MTDVERYPPIADYALLGDCHSAALVSRAGSIDWCCFHRFDAHPVFGRILDWDKGGYFRIAPVGAADVTRQYLPGTMVLDTRFTTNDGVVVVTDCLAVNSQQGPDDHPHHQLIRKVRCEQGDVRVRLEMCPRFDFGLTRPHIQAVGDHLWHVYGGADGLALEVPVDGMECGGCDLTGEVTLTNGAELWVSVVSAPPHRLAVRRYGHDELAARMATTRSFWQEWSKRCRYDGKYRDAVVRSALVLKALTNAPTGAIVAAPTTSLPEDVGGVRNWDYRYTWVRDATIELYALFRLGYTAEAEAFMQWLVRTTAGHCDDLQILYGVGGEHLIPEVDLDRLDGYRGSRPVRIGNAAVDQFQLDVFGHLLDAAWLYHRHGGSIDELYWSFLREVVNTVDRRWNEPDSGIWEVRSEPRHFVLSKVMAWVAVDRGLRLAEALDLPADRDRWWTVRNEIRAHIDEHGTSSTGAFRQSYDSDEADSSNLLIPLVGFVKGDDPRVRATVKLTQEELARNGLVYRYRHCDDGIGGDEGAFLICTFWMVGNLALLGEVDAADEMFANLVARANDVGLLAEEIDPHTGDHRGNFPQAFSHVGLIGAAFNLERAERRRSQTPPEQHQ